MNNRTFSILFPGKKVSLERMQPVFFGDLQLEEICKSITSRYADFDVRAYYYTLPGSVDIIRFRQNVYRDLEQNDFMITALKQYTNRLLSCEKCYLLYQQADEEVKKGSYLLLSCQHYLSALEHLHRTIQDASITSEGFCELAHILEDTFADSQFETFRDSVKKAFSYMQQMKLTLRIRDRELSVMDDEAEEHKSIVEQLKAFILQFDIPAGEEWGKLEEEVLNLFPAPLETSPLEEQIVRILKKSKPQIFQELCQFAGFDFSPDDDLFLRLKNEFIFYISFYEFEKQLNAVGHFLHFPEAGVTEGLHLTGVYDVALAWKKRFSGYSIVTNDICYENGKSFLVVTGPNQGGKTTLARAVGQSVYFMLLGLKAPCQTMSSRFFERILTHFEVEESVQTGAGKLKEELQRLKPMMHLYAKDSFVILNELFTTATTYDAQIMAQKVMAHFIQNHCLGVYVTHIQELADEEENPGIQSMVAQIDEEDSSVRTFKIIPMAAKGLGYSDSIVKKYGLDFEQVTKRMEAL